MSDEQQEQRVQVAQAEAQAEETTMGNRWGDPISEERRQELLDRLQAWQEQGGEQSMPNEPKGPFTKQRLSGADVFFLVAHALVGTRDDCPDLPAAQAVLLRARDNDMLRNSLDFSALHLGDTTVIYCSSAAG